MPRKKRTGLRGVLLRVSYQCTPIQLDQVDRIAEAKELSRSAVVGELIDRGLRDLFLEEAERDRRARESLPAQVLA